MKNKKIAIVTWTKWNNYGTILQSYALYIILQRMGFDVKVLNDKFISSTDCVLRYGFPTKYQFFKNRIRDFFHKRDSVDQIIYRREKKCDQFKHKIIQYHTKNVDYKHLHLLENNFDAFICGSDQIWTPNNIFFDPYYFLDFVKNKSKIAYAPSIGTSNYPENKKSLVAEMLQSFSYISTREETGKKILSNVTDKPIRVCLDPTLLLNGKEWINLLHLSTKGKLGNYVLCYFLGESDWYRNEVNKICKAKGLKKVIIPWLKKDIDNISGTDLIIPDPIDFLNLILNASFIFTDSYHGFIFSLQLHKEVFIFSRFSDDDSASQNSRVKDFCTKLNLQHRYINKNEEINLDNKINFQNIDVALNILRKDSMSYLQEALKNI